MSDDDRGQDISRNDIKSIRYSDVIRSAMASQIIGASIIYSNSKNCPCEYFPHEQDMFSQQCRKMLRIYH